MLVRNQGFPQAARMHICLSICSNKNIWSCGCGCSNLELKLHFITDNLKTWAHNQLAIIGHEDVVIYTITVEYAPPDQEMKISTQTSPQWSGSITRQAPETPCLRGSV